MHRVSASTSPARWRRSPASGALEVDQAVTDREAHQRRDVAHVELRHQAAAIGVDRRRQHPEQARYLLAGAVLDHELEDLAFSCAELVEGPNRFIQHCARERDAARAPPDWLSPFAAKSCPAIPDRR